MGDEEVYLVGTEEVVLTDRMYVQCDGGNGTLGHPREFLTLEKGGQTICKYCDRRFVLKSLPEAEAIRKAGQRFAA